MKKYFLLIIILGLMNSCDQNNAEGSEDQTQETVLTKEEKLTELYKNSVVPLFEDFENLNIPDSIKIHTKDHSVDAGAAFGYVEVSQGLVNLKNEPIQIFVLAHELAHIATLSQAEQFDLKGEIPRGTVTNDYHKAEYLADLIAIHLISKKLDEEFDLLQADFNYLQDLLGSASFTHPSGKDRMKSLGIYLLGGLEQNYENSFKNRFIYIWEMD